MDEKESHWKITKGNGKIIEINEMGREGKWKKMKAMREE